MRSRALFTIVASWVVCLALAVPALADEGGEGLYGKADDKVITNFGFGLMIFFTVLVIVLSFIQYRLDKRKGSK